MLLSAKTYTYIWSIGLSYDMFNPEGHHFPYFMATLLPFYGFFGPENSWKHLWPDMAISGQNWSLLGPPGAPHGHFHGGKRVPNDPPGCEIQCSTMFNQCSTHLRPLRLPKAKYDHFESKGAIKWP